MILSECRPVRNVKEFAVKYMCSKVKTPCLSQKTLISLKTGFLAMCLDFGQTTPTSPRADGLDSWYTLESNHGITDFPVRTTVARLRWWQWLASRRTLAWTSRPSPAQQQALSSTADGPRDALSIEVLSTAAVRTVWTSCTTNPQQIEVITAERYGRRTCTKTVSVVRV